MPQIEIMIGGRSFEVACQDGEEQFLHSAAAMLDVEAAHLDAQVGRMTEGRMLLMAGLLLADKTAGLEDQLHQLQTEADNLRSQVGTLAAQSAAPEQIRVEVPVVPAALQDALAEIAARAEALADQVEAR